MNKIKSLHEFVKVNESDVNEGTFYRLPKDIIQDELYLTSKDLQNFYDRTAAGNDIDPGVIETIIRNLNIVKKAAKKFNNKEEVTGTVYEGETQVFDELGSTIDELRSKISNLMKSTTDKKWSTALGQALSAISTLDRNLSNADAKLGVIPLKESRDTKLYVYPTSKKDHQMISNWLERSAFHAEENSNYFMFPVDGQRDADATETDLDKEFSKLGVNARFVLENLNEASVQIAGKAKPSGAKVLATVIIDMLDKQDFLHEDTKRSHKQLIDMVANVIMDSTF